MVLRIPKLRALPGSDSQSGCSFGYLWLFRSLCTSWATLWFSIFIFFVFVFLLWTILLTLMLEKPVCLILFLVNQSNLLGIWEPSWCSDWFGMALGEQQTYSQWRHSQDGAGSQTRKSYIQNHERSLCGCWICVYRISHQNGCSWLSLLALRIQWSEFWRCCWSTRNNPTMLSHSTCFLLVRNHQSYCLIHLHLNLITVLALIHGVLSQ